MVSVCTPPAPGRKTKGYTVSVTLLARAVETQNRVWGQMQEISQRAEAESRDLTAEERQAWDKAEADLTQASTDIERFERLAKLDKVDRGQILPTSGSGTGGTDAEKRYADAFAKYMRRGINRLDSDERELMEGGFSELRDQGTGTDPTGGYLVPEGFRQKLVEVMKAFGGAINLAESITTDTGQDLPWVGNDDTGNIGELLGENTAVASQDFAFTGRKLKAHIFSSKMVKVPLALLQDSAFDLDTWIPRKLGERIGRKVAQMAIDGTGVDQPEGVTTNVTTGKTGTTGQTTSVIYNDLLDLEHAIDPSYRNERCRFLMHDSSLKVIRKMVDGQSRPLWVPVPTVGAAATINGWPYSIDNNMPVMAASAKSILFGDFASYYVVRQVRGVQTMRLSERYAELLQVAFFAWSRLDGGVQDPNAVKSYVNAAS